MLPNQTVSSLVLGELPSRADWDFPELDTGSRVLHTIAASLCAAGTKLKALELESISQLGGPSALGERHGLGSSTMAVWTAFLHRTTAFHDVTTLIGRRIPASSKHLGNETARATSHCGLMASRGKHAGRLQFVSGIDRSRTLTCAFIFYSPPAHHILAIYSFVTLQATLEALITFMLRSYSCTTTRPAPKLILLSGSPPFFCPRRSS